MIEWCLYQLLVWKQIYTIVCVRALCHLYEFHYDNNLENNSDLSMHDLVRVKIKKNYQDSKNLSILRILVCLLFLQYGILWHLRPTWVVNDRRWMWHMQTVAPDMFLGRGHMNKANHIGMREIDCVDMGLLHILLAFYAFFFFFLHIFFRQTNPRI